MTRILSMVFVTALTPLSMVSATVLMPSHVVAQPMTAKTADGREVVLESDGTWRWKQTPTASKSQTANESPKSDKPEGSKFEWRGVHWGDSRSTVEKQLRTDETLKRVREKGIEKLAYEGDVGGYPSYVFLDFTNDDELAVILVALKKTFHNANQYFDVYYKWVDLLDRKYGESEINATWKNDLYQDDESHWGTAVSLGHLVVYNTWNVDGTRIQTGLKGENFDVSVTIRYGGPLHAKFMEESRDAEASGL